LLARYHRSLAGCGQPLSNAIKQIRRYVEVRRAKPGNRSLEIEHAAPMRFRQHADRAGNHQAPAFSLGATSPFVDQETVSIEAKGKRNGCLLTGIEILKSRLGRISHQGGKRAIQARTASGVFAASNSSATAWGTRTRS
jgi:hypothetical protein